MGVLQTVNDLATSACGEVGGETETETETGCTKRRGQPAQSNQFLRDGLGEAYLAATATALQK